MALIDINARFFRCDDVAALPAGATPAMGTFCSGPL
jgi:hypothetical protein